MQEVRTCLLVENDCYKAGRSLVPRGIMIHSTGANNPTLRRYLAPDDGSIGANAYQNDWNRPGVGACVHAFIGLDKAGQVQVYQTLPWTMRAWHCGAGGNDTHLSIEICEDGLEDRDYFEKTRFAAAELCAMLCKKFGLDPMADGVLLDHAEGWERGIASGHSDIGHWWGRFGYTMEDFRTMVSRLLEQGRYHRVEDCPKWARPAVEKLLAHGSLQGDRAGDLDLSEEMLRFLTILVRELERLENPS